MAERTATKKELRRQRRQDEKKQRRRTALRETMLIWGGVAVIVLVVAFLVFQQLNPANQPGQAVLDQGNFHLSSIDESHTPYNTTPPTSGPHMGGLWRWGISEEQVPDEWQIHNLEDGGVMVQYDCPEDCAELKQQLTVFAQEVLASPEFRHATTRETHFILAPYAGIRAASGGSPIALTAWTRLLYLDDFDRDKMLEFIRAYINIDHHVRGGG